MEPIAYIKGVLDGDAFISRWKNNRPRIILEVKDERFARKFISALLKYNLQPHLNERDRTRTFNGYTFESHMFIVRATCDETFLALITNYKIETTASKISYLMGMFDSEGNISEVQNYLKRNGITFKNGVRRSIRIYDKNLDKLPLIHTILNDLGICSKLYNYSYHCPFLEISRIKDFNKFREITLGD
jgi:hypothetical protein